MLRTPTVNAPAKASAAESDLLPCADFGGTYIKLGLVEYDRVVASTMIPAQSNEPLAARLPEVANALERLEQNHGVRWKQGGVLGVAFPSIIDPRTARPVDSYGKFADAPTLDLHLWASSLTLGLAIDNDARLALLGECVAGAARGTQDAVMVTLGTGIGTAALVAGRLLRGRHGQAGILGGHISLDLDGVPCVCGNRGCASTIASTATLPERVRSDQRFPTSALRDEAVLDYRALFAAAAAGDPLAVAFCAQAIDVWAATIVALIHAYDPERVIIGGGVAAVGDTLLDGLRKEVLARAHTPWGRVEIVPAELGQMSALIGAAALARGDG